MTTASTGAVFFLGTRAHYQVLQQPAAQYDVENGNALPESCRCQRGTTTGTNDNSEMGAGVKRRFSKIIECDRDNDMKPALLNDRDNGSPKKPVRRRTVLSYLVALGRRARSDTAPARAHEMRQLEDALRCSYRESCRCLDCQSRYFDCDETDDDYSSEANGSDYIYRDYDYHDYDYRDYDCEYSATSHEPEDQQSDEDEVFVNQSNDSTSTDLLIYGKGEPQSQVKMSTSSDEIDPDELQIEVAAGTPVFLNYLLTHPVTCCIQ